MSKITKDNAKEMQAKGAAKRKENTARRRALREVLVEELSKPVSKDSKMTKLEWLVAKALQNTSNEVDLSDLMKLQELLGEKQLNLNFETRKPSEVAADILNEIGD